MQSLWSLTWRNTLQNPLCNMGDPCVWSPEEEIFFRCAFVVGAVASLSQISGEGGRLLLSHWVSDCLSLLSAVSDCCGLVISRDVQLAEAAKAMDIWAEDTGPYCGSDCAIEPNLLCTFSVPKFTPPSTRNSTTLNCMPLTQPSNGRHGECASQPRCIERPVHLCG